MVHSDEGGNCHADRQGSVAQNSRSVGHEQTEQPEHSEGCSNTEGDP